VERSLKPWHNLGNVPNDFVLSRMALSPVDCLASISVKVAVVHSLPRLVQISLTRTGPASNDPRAKNHTSTVVLKPFGGTIHTPPHHALHSLHSSLAGREQPRR
jgi:hypothetical protein